MPPDNLFSPEGIEGIIDQLSNNISGTHETRGKVARNVAANSPVFYYVDLKGREILMKYRVIHQVMGKVL